MYLFSFRRSFQIIYCLLPFENDSDKQVTTFLGLSKLIFHHFLEGNHCKNYACTLENVLQ